MSCFIIIIGCGQRHRRIKAPPGYEDYPLQFCPFCGGLQPPGYHRYDKWFTFFFIPLFRLKKGRRIEVRCARCNHPMVLAARNAPQPAPIHGYPPPLPGLSKPYAPPPTAYAPQSSSSTSTQQHRGASGTGATAAAYSAMVVTPMEGTTLVHESGSKKLKQCDPCSPAPSYSPPHEKKG